MLEVLAAVGDGRNDIMYPGCWSGVYEDGRPGCRDLISEALGIERRELTGMLSFFINHTVENDTYRGLAEVSLSPGDHLELKALRDCLCAISACPDADIPGRTARGNRFRAGTRVSRPGGDPPAEGPVSSLRLALAQPAIDRSAPERARIDDAVELVAEAGREGADLLLFPESYPGPISAAGDYDASQTIAEAARAASCAVCWSRVEPGDDGLHCTVAYLVDKRGEERSRYVRSHPATGDVHPVLSGAPMAPGNELGMAELNGIPVGIAICSELWIPEIPRALAIEGAELLLAPAGGAFHRVAPNWQLIARARAIENGFFVGLTQQLFDGEEGSALIAGPEAVLAESTRPGLCLATLDLERARWLRENDDSMREPKPFDSLPGLLRARRPELYGSLTRPREGLYDYEGRARPEPS